MRMSTLPTQRRTIATGHWSLRILPYFSRRKWPKSMKVHVQKLPLKQCTSLVYKYVNMINMILVSNFVNKNKLYIKRVLSINGSSMLKFEVWFFKINNVLPKKKWLYLYSTYFSFYQWNFQWKNGYLIVFNYFFRLYIILQNKIGYERDK